MAFCGHCGVGVEGAAHVCGAGHDRHQGRARSRSQILQPAVRSLGIGRAPGSDVVVDRDDVSWNHARLQLRGGVWTLTDLGSSNGSFVNGARVDGPVVLGCQDQVRLGAGVIDLDLKRLERAPGRPRSGAVTKRSAAPRYDGFISYKHGRRERLAHCLEHQLGRFAKPLFRVRALKLFLDQGELHAALDLRERLEQALADSNQLVVLACPEWASSGWCQMELDWWLEHRGTDGLLIVLVEGDITWGRGDFDWSRTTALPRSLEGCFSGEPLWMDARGPFAMNMDDVRFRDLVVRLSAALHGKTVDELDGQALRDHRRSVTRAVVAALVLAILGLATGYLAAGGS